MRNWTRQEVAWHCRRALESGERVIIGIDHGFSFPQSYMRRYGLSSWDAFLRDFQDHWPTAGADTYVEPLREGNPRRGDPSELRLCERWTATTKSVFRFDVQGSVAKSTHAGLPWLAWLRATVRAPVRFWPFDGFEVPQGQPLVAEVYPSLFRRRYPSAGRSPDEHDAWSVAAWMREFDHRGALARYLDPPLTPEERRQATLEGWILGVW
jgi:hypothetical protein